MALEVGTVYVAAPLRGVLIVVYTVINIIGLCAGRIELGDTEEDQK